MKLDWTIVITALIAIVPTTLAVIVTWQSNKKAINEVHLSVNSKMDKLLEATKTSSFAEGRESGRQENK